MGRITTSVFLLILTLGAFLMVSFQDPADARIVPLQNSAAFGERTPPFPVVERAARAVRQNEGDQGMIAFLTSHVARYRDDPNNGYYLSVTADLYREKGAGELARHYYRRALFRYPDVTVRGVASHRVAINRLLALEQDPRQRVDYLHYLQDQYSDSLDRGLVAYHLAKAYGEAGRWPEAFESYRVFLAHPRTEIPGEPNARQEAQRQVTFYDSGRRWTHQDLDTLVARIKNALWRQDPAALLRHRAGENFFTMSWQQDEMDANSDIPTFDIGAFLRRSRVRFSRDLEVNSNASEAYLRTWGWSHRIPTWYLYFRRIDFPADPEVHGNWEWGGILFGEAF
ncbi:hypothetical protein AU468_13150 [Alkalispirochaeta sphaeroplastigenens]|uniref:Tetratricopeptide repeat protein n=1 Tax=Alkalispirochaeta sphaeroplastigenens TaxID=1187066 RepID=A0A2S4JGD0_9SPIO|nr:hypothetical protein [Alkalispirochaeta sphaeroplastigenens]POQ98525.1 hypothetical protein AU468_13150 [Alkalispirochaeta sphaeroplastigenens]